MQRVRRLLCSHIVCLSGRFTFPNFKRFSIMDRATGLDDALDCGLKLNKFPEMRVANRTELGPLARLNDPSRSRS